MTVPTIIAGVTAAAYLVYAVIKNKGIPESISATAYAVKHSKTFTVAMSAVAMLMLPELLTDGKPGTEWLSFASIAGLLMVGMTPNYKDKEEGRLHYIGAFLASVCSQVMLAINDPVSLLGWGAYPLLLLFEKKKNYAFWGEIICLLNIFFYLLYNTAK